VVVLGRSSLQVHRPAQHVPPRHHVHVAHVNVIGWIEVFERISGATSPVRRVQCAVRTPIA
jgi:hypothetical protein